jgi:dipeptidyl aminopeptidase/acylaminoacyl peptidase
MKRSVAATLLAAAFSTFSLAQTPTAALPPISDFARFPEYQTPSLSPNGEHLAVLMPVKNRMNLVSVDLAKRTSTVLTSIDRFDVLDFNWVGNDRIVFTLGERNSPTGPGRYEAGGLFAIGRDGKESRVLAPTIRELKASNTRDYHYATVVAVPPGSDKEVLISEQRRTNNGADLYKLDITTGKRELLTQDRPDRTQNYWLDKDLVPRVALSSVKDTDIEIVWYRESAQAPWTELFRTGGNLKVDGLGGRLAPVGLDDDNENLLVRSSDGRDTTAIFRFNVKTKKIGEVLASHAKFDLGRVRRDRVSQRVVGVSIDAEKPAVAWFDQERAKLQAAMDKTFPNKVNAISGSGKKVVVTSYDDVSSPDYYLYDTEKRTLEQVATAMPWLKKGALTQMRPFDLKTRDGLVIPSYYFLPNSYKAGDKLPTVVHIHGGPAAKADSWGPTWLGGYGVAEAQLLASRGYAVILPNHRITPGLGKKVYLAGKHSIGRQMSEDHEDATKWAIDQGFADPKRICITGASYGGYATLRALAKTPDLFKCGIAGLSVSNLELQLTSTYGDTQTSQVAQDFWREFIIGSDVDPAATKAMSPVYQADRIKAPLMMYAGAADVRTPLEQTNNMAKALRAAGNPPEMLIKPEEGHGFGILENRVDLWEKMLAFLDKHIGVGPTKP